MSKLRKGSAIAMLAVTTIGSFEGYRPKAYYDSVHVATVCYGETKGVRIGDVHTKAECNTMFAGRLDEFFNHVEKCVTQPMSDETEVAFGSLAYNIGWAGFCKSSVPRLYNEGRVREACDALMHFNRAGGRVLAGLTTRREKERELCNRGLGPRY